MRPDLVGNLVGPVFGAASQFSGSRPSAGPGFMWELLPVGCHFVPHESAAGAGPGFMWELLVVG
jgi:hypothetical protein